MISNIRNKLCFTLSLVNKDTLRNLSLSLILINLYAIFNISDSQPFGTNLLLTLNSYNYIFLVLAITCIFTLTIIKNFNRKYMIYIRYKDRDEYFCKLLLNTIILITGVYLYNYLIFFIMMSLKSGMVFASHEYIFYGIDSLAYSVWLAFRNYLYIIYVTSILLYINCNSKRNYISYVFFGVVFFCLLVLPNIYLEIPEFLDKFLFSHYLSFIDYGSLISEIISYSAYLVIKFFLTIIIIKMLNISIKKNFRFLLLSAMNFFNKKKNIFYLLLYIMINLLNIMYLTTENMISPDNILLLKALNDLSYVEKLTKVVNIVLLNYFFLDNVFYDLENSSSFLLTRLSKKRWLRYKLLVLFIITLIIRMPLYIIVNFSSSCLFDFCAVYLLAIGCLYVIKRDMIISKFLFGILNICFIVLPLNSILLIVMLFIIIGILIIDKLYYNRIYKRVN